jgi:hypothetical protein
MSVKLFQDNTEEKEASVRARASALALFQPAFAEASAGAVPRTDKSCNELSELFMFHPGRLSYTKFPLIYF